MKHDSKSQIQPITTDPITGEYKLTIPEWMINEYGWYEGMNLEWFIDIDGIHILEEEEWKLITSICRTGVYLRIWMKKNLILYGINYIHHIGKRR